MRFATFEIDGKASWGMVDGEDVIDLASVEGGRFPDLKTAIATASLTEILQHVSVAKRFSLSSLKWLPTVPNPDKILCVGLNYENHRKETGRTEVGNPTIFGRFSNSQTGHLRDIPIPKVSTDLDFEGELAIIIGKPGRYIPRHEAMSYVAGYSCYNDASVRDYQYHTHQFTPGKNFPETGAFGPWMMTPDELGDLASLRIRTTVNEVVVQDASFSEMIFDVPTIIAYCSSFTRLEPGDVIATGTPGGVGAKRQPPLWLKPGDVVEVSIDKLGVLRNGISEEKA